MTLIVSERAPDQTDVVGSQSLRRYLHPRFWPTWAFVGWLGLAANLPYTTSIRLHRRIGRLLWRVARRRRQRIESCLASSFPELDASEIRALCHEHFEHVGACVAELGIAWFGRAERLEHLFRIDGRAHLDEALERGKGVILYSGHFTTIDTCVPVVKQLVPHFAFMYSRRRNPLLNEFQLRGRQVAAHESFARNSVRSMLRTLSRNGVVWYAPDQTQSGSCEWVRFLGTSVEMSTATSRLARASGAAIVPFFFARNDDDSGYLLSFEPALEAFPTADQTADTERLTRVLERFVRRAPGQYLWNYRRFARPRPAPEVPCGVEAPSGS